MAEDYDRPQTILEMVNRIIQTAKNVIAQTVAGDPDDEKVIGTLGKKKFNWNTSVGTAHNGCKGLLSRGGCAAWQKPDVIRIDINAELCRLSRSHLEQLSEGSVTSLKAHPRRLGINRQRPMCNIEGEPVFYSGAPSPIVHCSSCDT
jgi:hypothetical protein